jgi:hypothetical protein
MDCSRAELAELYYGGISMSTRLVAHQPLSKDCASTNMGSIFQLTEPALGEILV